MNEVTHILSAIESGEPGAAEALKTAVYSELPKLAALRMAQEHPPQMKNLGQLRLENRLKR